MALVPQYITDQITDQNTPYCSELGDGVSNINRVLEVTWCRYREPTSVWGHHLNQSLSGNVDVTISDFVPKRFH